MVRPRFFCKKFAPWKTEKIAPWWRKVHWQVGDNSISSIFLDNLLLNIEQSNYSRISSTAKAILTSSIPFHTHYSGNFWSLICLDLIANTFCMRILRNTIIRLADESLDCIFCIEILRVFLSCCLQLHSPFASVLKESIEMQNSVYSANQFHSLHV